MDGNDAVGAVSCALGTFDKDGHSIQAVIKLSETEFQELDHALQTVARLDVPFDVTLIERNFLTLQDIYELALFVLSLGRDVARPNRILLGQAVMNAVINWLTSMRLFLDHTETDLKRRFGKTSPEVLRFKEATRAAYDTRPGYRFAYHFRNYAQHCGLPLSSIQLGPAVTRNSRFKQSARLLVSRDTLLSNFTGWGRQVKKDLSAMDDNFCVLPLISEAMESLRNVYHEVRDVHLSAALTCGTVLQVAINRVQSAGLEGRPGLFRYMDGPGGNLKFTYCQEFPVDAIDRIAEVANGLTERRDFFANETRGESDFGVERVRTIFGAGNRGVELFAVWLVSGMN